MESNQEPLGGTDGVQATPSGSGEASGSSTATALPHIVVVVYKGQVQDVFGNRPFRYTVKDYDHIEAGEEFIPTLDAFDDGEVCEPDEFLRALEIDLE